MLYYLKNFHTNVLQKQNVSKILIKKLKPWIIHYYFVTQKKNFSIQHVADRMNASSSQPIMNN